ncbi:dNA primase [Mycoplasma sp. CAG:611]|nr:dNA primase [Mycoplasma sp. CAG:611]
MNDNDLIKEVRSASNIVDVISSYLPLVKKGKNYFGVCPFHDDNNPSMSVSEDKQIYKCFSCGASGNVFNFVMDYEKIDFKSALYLLAKRSGINVSNNLVKTNNKNDKFYEIYNIAEKYYQNNLNTSLGLEAKSYLHNRGIDDELIKHFKIGLSLKEQDGLVNLLVKKNYSIKDISLIGLSNMDKDLYINRIMFPLFNTNGNTIGFSGRIYNMKSDSKYINTRETLIFKKGENLYNYHLAKDEARKEKSLIVVEGFMDVIRLYSIGVKNVVALMGTSLTKEQTTLIKRTSTNIILMLDGDNPGKKAIVNVGHILEEENLRVNVVALPEELDPDEYILKYGKERFINLLNNPIEYSEFKINYLKEGKDLTKIDEQSSYVNEVLQELSNIDDDIKKELILKKLEKEFNLDIEFLRNKLQNMQKSGKIETLKKPDDVKLIKLDKYQKATYAILNEMLNNYNAIKTYEKRLNYLPYETARYLANEIIYYSKHEKDFVLADFITQVSDKEELALYLKEVLKYDNEVVSMANFDDYLKVIEEYKKNQEIKRLKELMKKEVDQEKKALIADKIRLVKMGS